MPSNPPAHLLPVIVFSQVAGTSLWFAGNAVIGGIQQQIGTNTSIALITSIIQIGFILGTAVFAFLAIADRYPASTVFALSALIAALANLAIIWWAKGSFTLCALRFITGFFLAGIYPVGMKIAADLFPERLGKALGFLVGALVLGTALPHLLRALFESLSWQWVIVTTSLLALSGGLLVYFLIPSKKRSLSTNAFQPSAVFSIFRSRNFNAAALGYFGHMWELYAFWAFVPFALQLYNGSTNQQLPIAITSFIIIGFGCISCIIGGKFSQKWGSQKVANIALMGSGICCLLSPFAFLLPPVLFILFLLVWSGAVIADSPQFSTLVAKAAEPAQKGTALTSVTSIGFAITIVSIQTLQFFKDDFGNYTFLLLAPGPFLGLYFFRKLKLNAS